jgi:hypothetical protein
MMSGFRSTDSCASGGIAHVRKYDRSQTFLEQACDVEANIVEVVSENLGIYLKAVSENLGCILSLPRDTSSGEFGAVERPQHQHPEFAVVAIAEISCGHPARLQVAFDIVVQNVTKFDLSRHSSPVMSGTGRS